MRLKKNNNRKSKSVLRTWICSYMLVLLIIISLVFAANQVYRRFIIDSITQLKYLELANIQKSMDEIANNSKKAVLQIYGDRSISEIFKRGYSLESNRIRVKEIMVSMKHQMPAIDDFYIFMKDENLVLSSIGYMDTPEDLYDSYYKNANLSYDEWYSSLFDCKKSGYNVIHQKDKDSSGTELSEICYSLPLYPLNGRNITVVSVVNSRRYANTFEAFDGSNNISFVVYDVNGTRYFTAGKYMPSQSQLKKSEKSEKLYEVKIKKERVVIRNSKSSVSGWRYAVIIPYKVFWEKIISVKYVSGAIIILLVVLGVICIYIASRRNYRSLSHIISKIEKKYSKERFSDCNEYEIIENILDMTAELDRDIQMQEKDICAGKIFNLLLGVDNADFGIDLYREYDNMFRSDYFVVLVFSLHSYRMLFTDEDMTNEERFNTTKLIIKNIVSELLEKHGSVNVVGNGNIIFLFSPDESVVNDAQPLAEDNAHTAIEFIKERFKLSIECGISSVKHGASDICIAYTEACDAVRMRIPNSDNGIYVANNTCKSETNIYYSPEQERYFVSLLAALQ